MAVKAETRDAARYSSRPVRHIAVMALAIACAACGSAPVGPGYYRIERGDTLSVIARKHGQSVSNLTRWNNITNPNQIDVNQVIRVAPPAGSGAIRTENAPSRTETWSAPAKRAETTPVAPVAPFAVAGPPASKSITLSWPAPGALIARFDGKLNKGLDFAGQTGDNVESAAPGEVAYVGHLRGYGNLVVIKHSNGFLTSYGHLQSATVKEGQQVRGGQSIARIGSTEASRPTLHFELRYNGAPVDPMKYLPAR